jgi:hypothetical protein
MASLAAHDNHPFGRNFGFTSLLIAFADSGSAGRLEDAIAAYKKSLELDPNNENARRRLEELGAYP